MSSLEKILAAARAAAATRKRELTTPLVLPRSTEETQLAEIWRSVLTLDAVGVEDGFFELGGNSIQLAHVGARIVKGFGVDVPLATLFENVTLGAMAAAIVAARQAGATPSAGAMPPLVATEARAVLPLTFAQHYYRRLYEPNHTRFMEIYRLDGALDVAALERALAELVCRHEVLRTSIELRDGVPVQIVHASRPLSLSIEDSTEGALSAIAQRELERVVDLATGPLFECRLARLGGEQHALFLSAAHVVVDDWSLDLLFKEMLALYNAFAAGSEPSLPAPALQYRDYALWQEKAFGAKKDVAFWRSQLEGAEALALPTDRPRVGRSRGRQRPHPTRIPLEVVAQLREIGAATDASLFMTLLAAYEVFLHRATSQARFIVRGTFANRDPAETEAIVGSFSHPLPFRADLSGDPSFREVLRRVRADVVAVHAHRPVPFDLIARDEALWEDFDRTCNRAGFNLLLTDRSKSFGGMKGLTVSSLANVWRSVIRGYVDLYLFAMEKKDGMDVVAFYNEELFDAARIAGLLDTFGRVLAWLGTNPDEPISKA